MTTIMVIVVFLVFVTFGLWVMGCDSEGPTGPDPVTTGSETTATTPRAAAPAVEPTPSTTPTPSDLSYVELSTDGSGIFCAMPVGGTTGWITYTKLLDLSVVYGHYKVSDEIGGTCAKIPAVKDVIDPDTRKPIPFPWCGLVRIQVDVNQSGYLAGRHIGHVFADAPGNSAACDPCREKWIEQPPVVKYGEWGACTKEPGAATCAEARTKTTTISEQNSCTGVVRVKSETTTTETRACDCACVPVWEEQAPEITYTEWGACQPVPGTESCGEKRTKTTVVKEKNTCTGEVREKSRATSEESRPCTCQCIPSWVEQPAKITYGEWGECLQVTEETCAEKRTKTTVVTEKNSCTAEEREKSRSETEESRACECETPTCEVRDFDQTYCIPVLSGTAEEREWLNGLGLGTFTFIKKVDVGSGTWVADADYAVLIAKDGSCVPSLVSTVGGIEYRVYTNVLKGESIDMFSGKEISHVTLFGCSDD